jgi:hypothetical protein
MSARDTTIPESAPDGGASPGRIDLAITAKLCLESAVFLAVSRLSDRHHLLLVPGCS